MIEDVTVPDNAQMSRGSEVHQDMALHEQRQMQLERLHDCLCRRRPHGIPRLRTRAGNREQARP